MSSDQMSNGQMSSDLATRIDHPAVPVARALAKAAHYKVICISLYNKDLSDLDEKVFAINERRGNRRMSRSELIRLAVAAFDIDSVP